MKQISKSFAIVVFFLLIISTLKAQFGETLFYDTLSKVQKRDTLTLDLERENIYIYQGLPFLNEPLCLLLQN